MLHWLLREHSVQWNPEIWARRPGVKANKALQMRPGPVAQQVCIKQCSRRTSTPPPPPSTGVCPSFHRLQFPATALFPRALISGPDSEIKKRILEFVPHHWTRRPPSLTLEHAEENYEGEVGGGGRG